MTPKKTLALLAMSVALTGLAATATLADRKDGSMPFAKFDALDADKDGKITAEEFAGFRAAQFAKADTNADGKLDAAELAAMHLAQMTEHAADMTAKMIERMDDDGDGFLSAAEMERGPRLASIFERADADGDGAISKDEAEAMKDKMHRRHGAAGDNG